MIASSYQFRFELRHLRSFLVIAEVLSFRKAADLLHVAQPALSRQMSQLEQALGCRLFDRQKRKISLTSAGEYLYQSLPGLLAHLHETTEQAQKIASGQSAILRFGYSSAAMSGFLPQVIREIQASLAHCEFRFVEATSNKLIEGVINRRLDAAFVLYRPESDLFTTIPIRADRIGVILPADHPLKVKKQVSVKDLREEPLILFPRDTNPVMYDEIISACQEAGFSPGKIIETAPRSTAIGLVAAGQGVATIAESLRHTCVEGTIYRPLLPPAPTVNYACIIRYDRSSQWQNVLMNFIETRLS